MRTCSPLLLTLLACVPELPDGQLIDEVSEGEGSEGESSEGGDPSESDTAGAPDLGTGGAQCDAEAFHHAPEPFEYPHFTLVPVDVLSIEADLDFDPVAQQSFAAASLMFRMGETRGWPMLDLRQTPTAMWLDGEPLALDRFSFVDFGGGPEMTLRALEVDDLDPCTVHELTVHYPLARPLALNSRGVHYYEDPPGVNFDFDMTDLDANRYLESWIPANLTWDRHSLRLRIHIDGERPHTISSNGTVVSVEPNAWVVDFPSSTTSFSPMLRILPRDQVIQDEGELVTSDGRTIAWHVTIPISQWYTTRDIADFIRNDLDEVSALGLGPYPWDSVDVGITTGEGGMEYRAATSTALMNLEHELTHSWVARGIEPATASDGWFDEAFTVYVLEGPLAGLEEPWDVELYDPNPFVRKTSKTAYVEGRMVFTRIAEVMGHDELMAAMRGLLEGGAPRMISTAELELYLYCESGEMPEIREIFTDYVYTLGQPERLYGCD